MLRTAGLRVVRWHPSASSHGADLDAPGDGSVVLGIGLPGLIASAMFATVILLVIGRGRRSRFRFK